MALNREEKEKIINDFKMHEGDTGSTLLQVALLTENIRQLTEHLKENPKDFSSKRGMLKMVSTRKKFLKFIEQEDANMYKDLIERLGLRK